MPRPPRIQFEGATYHVYSRGNRRERIFLDEKNYAVFEAILLEAMRWSGIQMFNWSLMPNHFHLNLETPDGNLAEFMQRLLTRYAKYFNRTHGLIGHLFQGRYGARLVDEESHFQEIVRYVELNPYRLKSGRLAQLGAWKWSSLRYYLQAEERWPEGCRTAFRKVLERFGADATLARRNLARFLADGLESGNWEDFYQVRDGRFVGDDSFIETAKIQNKESVRSTERPALPRLDLKGVMSLAQIISGLSAEDFASGDQGRVVGRWRKAVAYVARHLYRISLVEVGRVLSRDSTTISHMLQKIQNSDDLPEIKQLTDALNQHHSFESHERSGI